MASPPQGQPDSAPAASASAAMATPARIRPTAGPRPARRRPPAAARRRRPGRGRDAPAASRRTATGAVLAHGGPAGAGGLRAGRRVAAPDGVEQGPVDERTGGEQRRQQHGRPGQSPRPASAALPREGGNAGRSPRRAPCRSPAMPGAARVPRGQRAAQRQGQAQIGRQRQRDAFQRQAGLRDGGVDDGHQVLVADGDGQRAVLDQRQALVGVRRQRHARGVGRDDQAQDVQARQRQRLSGLDQPRRHRAHRGAHDVGDIGGMEHRQADDQRGEFDAGLPAALQAQSAPDWQFDDGRGQEGPGEQQAGQRQPGRDADEQNVSAMRGSIRREPPASNRPARDQHGDNQARRLRQPALQRRQRQSAIDSSTDGSGSQAWRASGRRSSRPYQTKSCNSTGCCAAAR